MLVGTLFGTPFACIFSRSGLGNGVAVGGSLFVRCFLAADVFLCCCIRAALIFRFDTAAWSALASDRASRRASEPLPSWDRVEKDWSEWNWRWGGLDDVPNLHVLHGLSR